MKTIFYIVEYNPWIKGLMTPMLVVMGRDYEQVRQDLARNMKDFRGKRGLSQEALALSADVDRTYVSQIERAVGNLISNGLRYAPPLLDVLDRQPGTLLLPRRCRISRLDTTDAPDERLHADCQLEFVTLRPDPARAP